MAFVESPRLVDCIGFGVTGGPGFSTDVITTRAGHESRNANFAQARHRYEIGLTVRPKSEFEAIRNHFMAVGGRRDGFRFKDWADFEVTVAKGGLAGIHGTTLTGGFGIGYGTPTYQLEKIYTVGANSYRRAIRKPITATNFNVYRGGVLFAAYTVAQATGIVTLNAADQTRAVTSWGPGTPTQVTLASAFSPNLAIGGRIYFTGVTGTAASLLNGLSHTVTTVSSNILDLSNATSGLTASGGTAYYYPQPTEALAWSGEFDVPVRFDVDQFDAVIVNRAGADGELLIELPSVPLIEIRV